MMKRINITLLLVFLCAVSYGQNVTGNYVKTRTVFYTDTTYTPTGDEPKGTIYFDPDELTTSRVVGNGVILQDGQELFVDAINQTGALLEDGKVAMFAGALGASGKIKVQYGIADLSIITYPEYIIGVVTEDIANGDEGKITTYGKVRGIQTDGANYGETWADGDELYVSPFVYGALTNIRPNAPYPAISIAAVVTAHATMGTIMVRPTFPESLEDLTDVNGTPLTTTGQFPVWDNDNSWFDFDYNIIDVIDAQIPDSVWHNINSAARLWGGLITDNGDGTVSIGAGAGQIKAENAGPEDVPMMINEGQGSELGYVSWDAVSSLSLTDDAYNFIYFDGTDSTIKATTDFYSISFTQDFTLGRGYRDGTDVVIRLCGTNLWNFNRRVQLFGEEVFPVVRGTGLIIGETGTLQFSVTSGVLWAELVNRFSVAAYDGTITDFTYWYRDGVGGWTKTTASQIDNQNYDNGSGTLQALTANRYGVHWVYVVHDGSAHVVYGRDNYTLLGANNAFAPNTLPGLLSSYATLVGKITVQKSASTFTEVLSAFDIQLQSGTGAVNHNDLAGLDGGEAGFYGHLTSAELLKLQDSIYSKWTQLNDIPNSYTGFGDAIVTIASAETGAEFTPRANINLSDFNNDLPSEIQTITGGTNITAVPSGNDYTINVSPQGVGSLLDADLLDGNQGSYYLDYNNFTNTPDLSVYVPYTGATQDVDLGIYDLSATLLTINGTPSLNNHAARLIDIDSRTGLDNLTSGYVPYFTTELVNSPIYTTGTNVLIGSTTDNGAKLQVEGDATFLGDVAIGGATVTDNSLGGTVYIGNNSTSITGEKGTTRFWLGGNWKYDGGDKFIQDGWANLYSQQNGEHQFLTSSSSGLAGGTISFNKVLEIDNLGNATFSGTVSGANPTLNPHFVTLEYFNNNLPSNSYISNVTESGNSISFTGVGSAFNGSIGTIAKTDQTNNFSSTQYIGTSSSTRTEVGAAFVNIRQTSTQTLRFQDNLGATNASIIHYEGTLFDIESDDDVKLRRGAREIRIESGGIEMDLDAATSSNVVYYDTTTEELTYGAAPSGGGTVTSVAAGSGMDFTTITGSGNVTLGTPSTTTSSTSNATTTTSHTHALDATGVISGSYTSANITVDSKGRITSASNGSGGSAPAYGSAQEVPYMNDAGTGFIYSSNFNFDDDFSALEIGSSISLFGSTGIVEATQFQLNDGNTTISEVSSNMTFKDGVLGTVNLYDLYNRRTQTLSTTGAISAKVFYVFLTSSASVTSYGTAYTGRHITIRNTTSSAKTLPAYYPIGSGTTSTSIAAYGCVAVVWSGSAWYEVN